MEKINFLVGNESRFVEFIKDLDSEDKIALISHTDLDGLASARVVDLVISPDIKKFVGYDDLNDSLIEELKKLKVNKLIITDLSIKDENFIKGLKSFKKVLIIDHHLFAKDLNNEIVCFVNAQGYCASYLCYYLFSKIQDLDNIDWIVALASMADFAFIKNSEFMKETMKKYGDKFELIDNNIRRDGLFFDLMLSINYGLVCFNDNLMEAYNQLSNNFSNIGKLKKAGLDVKNDIESSIKLFEKEKKEINGRYFWEVKCKYPIVSALSTELSLKEKNKTFIFAEERGDIFKCSLRRQDGGEDLNNFAGKLVEGFQNAKGGGHRKAAGCSIMLKDKDKFLEKLRVLKN
jgi:oligoribonuclease NrnB/cAMP/cGMP phosphodiesterase (DHH superfamily)